MSLFPLNAYDAQHQKDYDNAAALRGVYDRTGVGLRTAAQLARSLSKRGCWICASAWDGIDPNSPFIAFSEGNPYARRYDALTS